MIKEKGLQQCAVVSPEQLVYPTVPGLLLRVAHLGDTFSVNFKGFSAMCLPMPHTCRYLLFLLTSEILLRPYSFLY